MVGGNARLDCSLIALEGLRGGSLGGDSWCPRLDLGIGIGVVVEEGGVEDMLEGNGG